MREARQSVDKPKNFFCGGNAAFFILYYNSAFAGGFAFAAARAEGAVYNRKIINNL